MTKIWNNIKKTFNNQDTIKFLIVLLFLVICIVLFIVIQQQDDTMNNLVNISKETFEDTNITIEVDGVAITNYNENNKLKLLNSNSEFQFHLKNLTGKNVSSINFINTPGNYQNVELIFDTSDEDSLEFSQFLNLDTAYKMVVYYSDSNSNKTVSHTFQTSMEFNYKPPAGGEINTKDVELQLVDYEQLSNLLDIGVDMKQFNYITFNIKKPNLNSLRVKLLETDFENDNIRNEYLKKLQQFDKLVPLKFDAKLSLIKNIGNSTNPQYVRYSEMDLREHRKNHPISERIVLPNPNCNTDNCQLQIRNVVANTNILTPGLYYILKIRLEYYYLDNIRNIRATPYLEFKFKVNDNGTNSFSISKLNIVGNLEETNKLKKIFEDTQKEQDTNLEKIENEFKKMIN